MRINFNFDANAELIDITPRANNLGLNLLYQELDLRRQPWDLMWAQIQAQSGIGLTTRIRITQRTEPSAEDSAKLKAWLRTWAGWRSLLRFREIGSTNSKTKS